MLLLLLLLLFNTTSQEDTAIFEAGQALSRAVFNAVIVRHAEKRIYVHMSEFASNHISLLEVTS
jgi:hypothetical protein